MNPLISVIVPVYKVENYLDRCLKSIMEQTYKNLEIILVDDGSPDNSGKMCDEWAKKDGRIIVIHKENGGLSDARNEGTKAATGEYITYIDSDDYILKDYIEHLYINLVKYGADISCCDFERVDRYIVDFDQESENISCISGREACSEMLTEHGVYFVIAPCKLYKLSIAQKYEFPKGLLNEDEATTYKYLYESEKVCISNKKLYGYFQNQSGIMHNMRDDYFQNFTSILIQRADFYKEKNDSELEQKCWNYILPFAVYHHLGAAKRIPLKDFIYLTKLSFKKKNSRKEKFKFILYFISPTIYKKIIEIIGKE